MVCYTPKEFEKLLIKNGWRFVHQKGSHRKYIKDGFDKPVIFPFKGNELCLPLAKRLIKEAQIIT